MSIWFYFSILFLGGCFSLKPSYEGQLLKDLSEGDSLFDGVLEPEWKEDELLEEQKKKTLESSIVEKKVEPPALHPDFTSNDPAIDHWIHFFSKRHPEQFHRSLTRGVSYKKDIDAILAEADLPKELYYLPVIESSYVPFARSHARAVGIWQFIRATGVRYGLKVDS